MTISLTRSELGILISYINHSFEIFTFLITKDDSFLISQCNRDFEKMEAILRDGVVNENGTWCIFRIERPIVWNFILNKKKIEDKGKELEFTRMILEKMRKIEQENEYLKEKLEIMEKTIADINDKITDGVILPGYGGAIIDQSCEQLRLVASLTFYVSSRPHNNSFVGKSIKPLTRLANLQEIIFENYNGFDFDLSQLARCKRLNRIIFINCFNYNLPNFGRPIAETIEDNKQTFEIGVNFNKGIIIGKK